MISKQNPKCFPLDVADAKCSFAFFALFFQCGRKLAEDPANHSGSLGIAISEAVEVAAKNSNTAYALGSVLNHVLLHQVDCQPQIKKIFNYAITPQWKCQNPKTTLTWQLLHFAKIRQSESKTQLAGLTTLRLPHRNFYLFLSNIHVCANVCVCAYWQQGSFGPPWGEDPSESPGGGGWMWIPRPMFRIFLSVLPCTPPDLGVISRIRRGGARTLGIGSRLGSAR